MPSIIIDKKQSGQYIRIVESFRDESGRPKTKTLYSLGRVDSFPAGSLKRMGERLFELGGGDLKQLVSEAAQEEGRFNYGYPLVYGKILAHYGLERLFDRITKKKKLSYSLSKAVLLMLCERLSDPASKRANYFNQQDYLGFPNLSLHHLYRALDHLAAHSELIQQHVFHTGRDLFNQSLDVVFYDVTTFYFDSEVEQEGSLRQKGFGKDGKVGKTQVVFAMLIDRYKQPIGYQLYHGKQWEGHTYEQAIDRLKKKYQVDKVVVVADRGMNTTDNRDFTTEAGYEFIMGERFKNLPQQVQTPLLDLDSYPHKWTGSAQHPIQYKTIQHQGRHIIGTYSQVRAKKDRIERENKLEKAKKLLEEPSQFNKKAAHYYLKKTGKEQYEFDLDKIKRSEKYDGFMAIAYHAKGLTQEQVLDQYHHLYQIEHTFRTFKSYLETRPMFHWTNRRIEGHICLCYLAYTLLNHLGNKLSEKGSPISETQIRKTLDGMQLSWIKQANRDFYLRAKPTENSQKILSAMQIKSMPDLFPKELISSYL